VGPDTCKVRESHRCAFPSNDIGRETEVGSPSNPQIVVAGGALNGDGFATCFSALPLS
jgi:hypothetical protein